MEIEAMLERRPKLVEGKGTVEMKIYGFKILKPPQAGPNKVQFLHMCFKNAGKFLGIVRGIHCFGIIFGRRISVKWYVKL